MKNVLSVLSFVYTYVCLEIGSLVFYKFWHSVRNPYEIVCNSWIFCKKTFCPKNRENGSKFYEFIEKDNY